MYIIHFNSLIYSYTLLIYYYKQNIFEFAVKWYTDAFNKIIAYSVTHKDFFLLFVGGDCAGV